MDKNIEKLLYNYRKMTSTEKIIKAIDIFENMRLLALKVILVLVQFL